METVERLSLAEITTRAMPVLERYGATRAGLFGSAARSEMGDESDLDILVELGPEPSLLDVARMNRELEEALGRRVDLVEYATLKPRIRGRVLAQEVRIRQVLAEEDAAAEEAKRKYSRLP